MKHSEVACWGYLTMGIYRQTRKL